MYLGFGKKNAFRALLLNFQVEFYFYLTLFLKILENILKHSKKSKYFYYYIYLKLRYAAYIVLKIKTEPSTVLLVSN